MATELAADLTGEERTENKNNKKQQKMADFSTELLEILERNAALLPKQDALRVETLRQQLSHQVKSPVTPRVVVVTGGTKGIGRAILEKFAFHGYDLITCARNQNDLLNLKQELESKYSIKVFVKTADMSKPDQVAAFGEFVKQLNHNVDVLVNNAGFFLPGGIMDSEEGQMELMLNANVLSAYHVTRGIVEEMVKRGKGDIFNMCSIASIKAYAGQCSYATTKFALLGFTKSLREEMKDKGVRVVAIMPGATLTPIWGDVELPETRFMKAEDVADTVFNIHKLSDRCVVEEVILRPQLGDI